MKCCRIDIISVLSQKGTKPFFKLARSLVCKSNGKYIPWLYRTYCNSFPKLFQIGVAAVYIVFKEAAILCTALIRVVIISVSKIDHICNTIYNNRCFSASCSGKNKNRTVYCKYCFFLFFIHSSEIFF